MKFSIEKKDLNTNIQQLIGIVPSRNTMPILTNYLIEANEETGKVKFTSTDLEITVVAEFPANISESGRSTVLAKNFNEIVNSFPDDMINVMLEEEKLIINCQKSHFHLNCADTTQFPMIPLMNFDNALKIDAQMFKKMINSTSFAVSSDINRPIFTGINWKISPNKQMMAATDIKKIAEFKTYSQLDIPDEIELIIPRKGLLFLERVINENNNELLVIPETNRIIFNYNNFTIFSHLIKGKFPDYTQAIPQNNTNILTINKSLLKNVVRRVSLLASEETLKIRFDINDSGLALNAMKREEGDADEKIEDIQYEGEHLIIAFNYKFLIEIINAIDSENIVINMGTSNEPALFVSPEKHDEYNYRYILMPLRLA
ncbi:MAG: DNA polymerase III subunit beta [Candidatus Cloacimonetes bacterium]|nr:DNA polymerase III subunit beta [Candidatus Cloacimonadota bacterium]